MFQLADDLIDRNKALELIVGKQNQLISLLETNEQINHKKEGIYSDMLSTYREQISELERDNKRLKELLDKKPDNYDWTASIKERSYLKDK